MLHVPGLDVGPREDGAVAADLEEQVVPAADVRTRPDALLALATRGGPLDLLGVEQLADLDLVGAGARPNDNES